MSLKNEAFHGILWTTTTNILMKIINFVISITLARLLTPSDFGLMSISLALVYFFEIFRDSGIGQAMIQKKENIDAMADSAFFTFPIISFLLCAVLYFVAPVAAEFFKDAELIGIIRVLSLTLVIWSFGSLPQTLLTKRLEFKKLAGPRILSRIGYGTVTILMALLGFGVWSLVWGQIVMITINAITNWYSIEWRPSLRFDIKIVFELLSYGKHIIATSVLIFFVSMIDITVIGRFLGSEELGYYSIALTVAGIFTTQISTTFSAVAFPIYSKLQENKNKLREAYLKTLKSVSIIIFPAAFGIISVAHYFIEIFYGDKWLPAVVVLQVLCINGLSGSIIDVTKNLYLAIGKPKIMTKIYFFQFFLILILIGPLTNEYGIIGTSVAVAISSTVSMFLSLNEAKKLIGKDLLNIINSMLPSSTGSIFMVSLVFIFQVLCDYLQSYLILFLSIVIGASSYCLFFRLIYKEELEEIKWLVNAKVRS